MGFLPVSRHFPHPRQNILYWVAEHIPRIQSNHHSITFHQLHQHCNAGSLSTQSAARIHVKLPRWRRYTHCKWSFTTIEVLGFDSRQVLGIFLFTTAPRTALGPTQPPIQWVPGALSLGVKRSGREADHSHPSSAEVKNAWGYNSTPRYAFMAWCSVKENSTGTTLPLLYIQISYISIQVHHYPYTIQIYN
jgi:hypothetical protein